MAFCPKQMGLHEMLGEEIAGLMSYEAHAPILFNNFGTMGVGTPWQCEICVRIWNFSISLLNSIHDHDIYYEHTP